MASRTERFSDRVVTFEALGSAGASGNKVERVTLDDGTKLICKRVSPEPVELVDGKGATALEMWSPI